MPTCDQCDTTFNAPGVPVGRKAACPHCGALVRITTLPTVRITHPLLDTSWSVLTVGLLLAAAVLVAVVAVAILSGARI